MKRERLLFLITLLSSSLCIESSENKQLSFIKQIIKSGDLVFDVGANVGEKTALYLKCGASVVCIEPQPHCIQVLKQRFKNNRNVIIEALGLAEKDDCLEMFVCSSSNTISTFSEDWVKYGRFGGQGYKWDAQIKVPVTTLDKIILKHGMPYFCKIDVEGFELQVLRGLTHKIPLISFEFAGESFIKTKECIKYLAALGYRTFNFGLEEHDSFLFKDWVSSGDLILRLQDLFKKNYLVWGDVYARYEKEGNDYKI